MIKMILAHLNGNRSAVRTKCYILKLHKLVHKPLDMLLGVFPAGFNGSLTGRLIQRLFIKNYSSLVLTLYKSGGDFFVCTQHVKCSVKYFHAGRKFVSG